jgi:anti-sigma-K factor RskA
MSDRDEDDAVAGAFALGTLDAEDRRAAEQRIAQDPAFARTVAAWERRLAPLAAIPEAAEPPADLWARIEQATAPAAGNVVPLRRARQWQFGTIAGLAIAASLAAFIVLQRPEPTHVAVLSPIVGGTAVLLATEESGGRLTVRPNGAIQVPTDRDLELWALAKGDTKPRSLGVLPAGGRSLVATLAPDTQLLVSLEPRGGSPTGQPTGPVVYGGTLSRVN